MTKEQMFKLISDTSAELKTAELAKEKELIQRLEDDLAFYRERLEELLIEENPLLYTPKTK